MGSMEISGPHRKINGTTPRIVEIAVIHMVKKDL